MTCSTALLGVGKLQQRTAHSRHGTACDANTARLPWGNGDKRFGVCNPQVGDAHQPRSCSAGSEDGDPP